MIVDGNVTFQCRTRYRLQTGRTENGRSIKMKQSETKLLFIVYNLFHLFMMPVQKHMISKNRNQSND